MPTSLPRRVGILGGTFNPVHNGHLHMAQQALSQAHLEQILWLPAGDPPHKPLAPGATSAQRRTMVALTIADEPRFQISDLELHRQGRSYAIVTVETLRATHPDWHWFWIIGADAFEDLAKWYQVDRLVGLCTWLVAPRQADEDLQEMIDRVSAQIGQPVRAQPLVMPSVSVSSTHIREACQQHQSITAFVPPAVARYIEEQGLYQEPDHAT
ncbi:MAG: nicotinate (nicotinamide) nucleotide adenylyltransferase [Synechococcales cyanobacterium]